MKRLYRRPRVLTQVIVPGLYGDYADGSETFGGGPANPLRLGGDGIETDS